MDTQPDQLTLDLPQYPRSVPVLVAFTGKAGSGKTAIADEMCDDEFAFIKVKFAAPLKDMLESLLLSAGVPEDELVDYIEGDRKEKPTKFLMGKSPRDLMLTLGTEWGREMVHPGFWVNIWVQRVRSLMDHGYSVVVDDLRFPNEAVAIRDLGGVIIRVDRESAKVVNHKSENYAPEPDYIVDNNGKLSAAMCEVGACLNI